jgi:hypothetical protein
MERRRLAWSMTKSDIAFTPLVYHGSHIRRNFIRDTLIRWRTCNSAHIVVMRSASWPTKKVERLGLSRLDIGEYRNKLCHSTFRHVGARIPNCPIEVAYHMERRRLAWSMTKSDIAFTPLVYHGSHIRRNFIRDSLIRWRTCNSAPVVVIRSASWPT